MDVNSINNNVTNLNNQPSLDLNKTSSSNKIEKIDEEGLKLSIKQYNEKRDELSIDVQTLNEGIAISRITQNSLEKQQEFVKDIQTKLENLNTEENTLQDNNEIKQSINEDLKNFNQVAYETKFKNQNLLNVDYYDEQKNIEIHTSSSNFVIDKPNTPDFANEIFEAINGTNLNETKNINDTINKIESTTNQLQNLVDDFTEFGNKLESSAKLTIEEQQNLYNANKANQNRDFGKESTDFNATNVNANAGYLAASQANIVQEQSVRLLS